MTPYIPGDLHRICWQAFPLDQLFYFVSTLIQFIEGAIYNAASQKSPNKTLDGLCSSVSINFRMKRHFSTLSFYIISCFISGYGM
jgi:hypothetical protein